MIYYLGVLLLTLWWFTKSRYYRKLGASKISDRSFEVGTSLKKLPGPPELPFIGGLLYCIIKKKKHNFLTYSDLATHYGPICGFKAGIMDFVIVNDLEISKQICNSPEFLNRYPDVDRLSSFYERSSKKALGLIFGAGKNWKDNRCFAIKNLKQFGFGKSDGMDKGLQEELEYFSQHLLGKLRPVVHDSSLSPKNEVKSESFILPVRHLFCVATTNILWNMVAGYRFSYDNARLKRLLEDVQRTSKKCNPQVNLYYAFPFLRWIPGVTNFRYWNELNEHLMEFSRELIHERKKFVIPNNPESFLDIYLEEIQARKGTTDESSFNEDVLALNCVDLFFGGSETSSNALEFGILYMILHPHVQEKVQMEIDTVIGANRLPTLSAREKMPYVEATILEILRWSNILPLNCRSPAQEVNFMGYHIPAGAFVITNAYGIHFSETLWDDPNNFRPERFLDDKMNLINTHKIIPFGYGKRICLGETLAKAAIFMFFTYLLQNYTFSRVSKDQKLSADPISGFSCSPQEFEALVTPRHRH